MGARSHTWVQKRLHLFWFKVFRCLDRSSGACRSHGGEGGRGEQLQHQAPPAPASSATCCLAGAVAGRWGCENNLHMSWFKVFRSFDRSSSALVKNNLQPCTGSHWRVVEAPKEVREHMLEVALVLDQVCWAPHQVPVGAQASHTRRRRRCCSASWLTSRPPEHSVT
jgi:hypothetical protein